MDRLTNPKIDYSKPGIVDEMRVATLSAAMCRLAAYEDTGLEPEMANQVIQSAYALFKTMENDQERRDFFEHTKDLLDAESEGRLIVLPCKVGDELWLFLDGKLRCETIDRITIDMTDEDEFPFTRVYAMSANVMFEDVGKTVFLTREEAAAALETKSGDHLWCRSQWVDEANNVACLAHVVESRVFNCPYADNKERLESEHPCSDYQPILGGKTDEI